MKQSWKDYEAAAERGPLPVILKAACLIALLTVPLWLIGRACSVVNETANVAHEEFGPRALLDKYEWFKDAAAALEKKLADIGVYEARTAALREAYGDTPRIQWPRDEREQMAVWASEVAGVKASYNALAAEYNAQMAKFNWRFANIGELPRGADVPLPREFKAYETK